MAKNMTLKSLAVGAAFALTASGLFAAPAQAAAGIDLAAQGGKSVYGMLSGEAFTFTANGNVDFLASNASLLRVEVVNTTGGGSPTGFAINGTALDGDRSANNGTSNTIELANGDETAVTLGATAGDKAVMGLGVAAAEGAATAGVSAMTSPFTFGFSATAADDTPQVYAVTVFADTNNNGVKDAGELASATQSVTFFHVNDVTVNYVIDDLTEGGLAVGADVTISGVALDQLTATEFGVHYTTGTDGALGGQAAKLDIVAFDTNKTKFESDLTLTAPALVKDTAVKAQLKYLNGGSPNVNGSDGAAVGSFATKMVVAAKVADVTASVVKSVNANATNFKPDTVFQVKALVEDATNGTADADPVAGQLVTAKIEVRNIDDSAAETLSATKYIVVNGVTYTDSTKLPGTGTVAQVQLTTDSNGEVVLNIETKGLEGTAPTNDDDTNSVKVTFTSELISDGGSIVDLEARDAAFRAYIANHDADNANTVDGAGVLFQVEVYDQYGARPADVYDARAVFVSSNQGATAASNSTSATSVVAPVVSGRASFTVTDNGTGTGANVYGVSVEARAAGGGYSGGTILAASEVDGGGEFTINIVANATAGALTVTGFTKQTTGADAGKFTKANAEKDLALTDFGNYNGNVVLGTEPTGLTFGTDAHQIAGTVTTAATATAAAVQIVGVPVTVSGAGLQFVYTDSDSKVIYAVDSITFPSRAGGAWSVDVYSNKAGKATITVTAGGVTETVVIDDYANAGPLTGSSWDLSGVPASVAAGYSFSLEALLTDKYGNPVTTNAGKVKISWNGPILTVPSTLPAVTDADGKIKFGVVPSANEAGTYTYTVQYAGADDAFDTADDVAATKSVTIGSLASLARGWTKDMGDGTIKVYARDIVGAGKVQFFHNGNEVAWVRATSANDPKLNVADDGMVRTRALVSGRNVFEIFVDGERIVRRIATGS